MRRILLALAAIAAALSSASAQESPATFYRGKTVRLIVGVGVGTGYDVNARALARHLGKHIPGNPTIIVQNQPGAGSLTMTNQMYAAGPFDGTVIGASFNGLPTAPLLQPNGVRFDSAKINWVGSTNRETQTMYVWHTAPMKTIEDLRAQEMLVGAQAPGSTQYDYPMLGRALFGLKFKVVTGYKSTSDINLAMERGEVHGTLANWSTVKTLNYQQYLDKKIRILVIWGARQSPELRGIPLIGDMATTPEQKQALQLAQARLEFGRPFFMPPNVPAERVNAIRRAFDATMKDKEYLVEAEKLKLEIDPMTGEDIAKMLEQIAKTPADVVARVRTAYEGR
jgi:tripartite-type tricarboxylate transporter receptor subunit TctC